MRAYASGQASGCLVRGRIASDPASAMHPGIKLVFERIDCASILVEQSMNDQTLALFPALDSAHGPTQIACNFFPGFKPASVHFHQYA
jgi:hypothetical protein